MDYCSDNIRFIKSDFYEPRILVKRVVRVPTPPTFGSYGFTGYGNCDSIVIKNSNPCERVRIKRAMGVNNYYTPRYVRKPLLNSKGQFFVFVSRKVPNVQQLIDRAQSLGLTVSGDGTNRVTGGSIVHVEEGNYITFGSSPRFDVNWILKDEYMCDKGYIPVYDIEDDWHTILRAVEEFANNKRKKTFYTSDGSKSVFHAGFAVVNGVVKKYKRDEVAVRMPVDTYKGVLESGVRRITVVF